MSKDKIGALLEQCKHGDDGLGAEQDAAVELAERVEAVLRFCSEQKATFGPDLEHTDPVVVALARGRLSATEQVLRALDGEER